MRVMEGGSSGEEVEADDVTPMQVELSREGYNCWEYFPE